MMSKQNNSEQKTS